MALFGQAAFKVVVVIVLWALAHHLLDGVRHMLTNGRNGLACITRVSE